jgi:EAL and modified HD-GYP domain-containing signal transduction protein
VKFVAEKVETAEEDELCRQYGFDYFQGYFYSKPQISRGRRPAKGSSALMTMLSEATQGDIAALKRLISQDVGLSYRFLRLINSASFSLTQKVQSVPHAVAMLGERRVRQWLLVILLAGHKDAGAEVLTRALVRAGMCEVLGLKTGADDSSLFTVGLLSTLESLLRRPMDEILGELPMSPEVEAAISRRDGVAGRILDAVVAYEEARWSDAMAGGYEPGTLRECYIHAASLADELVRASQGES